MNELKLSLHNFQSISNGELVFNTGLNFIIGQSNSGKSATFRALKACLLNPKGSQRFIKKGNNSANVTLLYNGNEIEWDKTSKESSYVINGQQFLKTGSSNAFKIMNDDAGFARDSEGVIMNIEEELQLPFPFGINSSDLFKLFENVFCVSDSAIILKSAKDYEKGVESEITSLDLEDKKIDVKLRELRDFKQFVDIPLLKEYKESLIKKQNRLDVLNDGKDVIILAVRLNKSGLEVEECNFNDLFSPYLAALECKKVLAQTAKLHILGKSIQELNYATVNLLDKYRELEDTQKLIKRVNKVERLVIPETSFSSRMTSYAPLVDLNKTVQKLRKFGKFKVEELQFKSKIDEYTELVKLYDYIQTFKRNIKDLELDKKREEERIKGIEEKLKEFKVCPLCHHSLEN